MGPYVADVAKNILLETGHIGAANQAYESHLTRFFLDVAVRKSRVEGQVKKISYSVILAISLNANPNRS